MKRYTSLPLYRGFLFPILLWKGRMSEKKPTSISVEDALLSVNFAHQLPADPYSGSSEKVQAETFLFFQKGRDLPLHAVALQAQNPEAIIFLIEELTQYGEVQELSATQTEMLQYTVTLLRELAQNKLRLVRK